MIQLLPARRNVRLSFLFVPIFTVRTWRVLMWVLQAIEEYCHSLIENNEMKLLITRAHT